MAVTWENRPLVDSETLSGVTGSDQKDLPPNGMLSGLIVEPYWENAAGGDNTLNVLELLTLIEVVHRGSERIKSFNGLQAAGVAWRRGHEYPFLWNMGNAGSQSEGRIVIPFGRHLYDTEYGLDLSTVKNPQIRYEWNYAYGTSGDTSGGFSSSAGKISIRAILARDGASFSHYIRTTKVDEWTIAASATEAVDLPVEKPWPRLYLWHNCADRCLEYDVAKVTLNVETGAQKPIVLEGRQLAAEDFSIFGSPSIVKYFASLNDTTLDVRSLFDMPWESEVETQGGTATCHNLAQGIYDPTIDLVASAATIESKLIEKGRGFGRLYAIPFDLEGIEAALVTRDIGKLQLEVEAASAVGTSPKGAVILEEIV
jgi:hypothetical protein